MKNSRFINGLEWLIDDVPIEYNLAVKQMESRIKAIKNGTAPELIWLLEHPSIYTAGTSAKIEDLIDPKRFPIFKTGRGGKYTYHGPGQRIVYVMLDLGRRGSDIKVFIYNLEEWIIQTLNKFNINGERREGRVGIWVEMGSKACSKEAKIASIGVRVRKWVTYHGLSINIDPNLDHFSGIIPCGVSNYGTTSFWDLGVTATAPEIDTALATAFEKTSKELNFF